MVRVRRKAAEPKGGTEPSLPPATTCQLSQPPPPQSATSIDPLQQPAQQPQPPARLPQPPAQQPQFLQLSSELQTPPAATSRPPQSLCSPPSQPSTMQALPLQPLPLQTMPTDPSSKPNSKRNPKSSIFNLDEEEDDAIESVDPDDEDWTPGSGEHIPCARKPISRPKRTPRRSAPSDFVRAPPPKRSSKRKAHTPAVEGSAIIQPLNTVTDKQATIIPQSSNISTDKLSSIPQSTFQIGQNGTITAVPASTGSVQCDVFVINSNGAVERADQGMLIVKDSEGKNVGVEVKNVSGVSETQIQSQNCVDVTEEKRNENELSNITVVGPMSPSILTDDEDSLPNVPVPNKDMDDSELPDLPVPAKDTVSSGASSIPSITSFFGRPSFEPPTAKKPKVCRAPKKPAAPRGKGAGNKAKLPVVPETPETASLTRRLSALQKDDLIGIIKRAVYFGRAPTYASIGDELPKPNVKEFAKVLKKLKSAVMKAVPNPRHYNPRWSSRDHYSFLRCQRPLNDFAKVASEQIATISKLEDWNGALEYALSAGIIFMDLPHWENESDNYHEPRIKGQLTELLIRALPRLSFTTAKAQALLDEIEEKQASDYFVAAVSILKKLV